MKRALRRAATSRRLFLFAALLLTVAAPVGGTWAYFNASTVNSSSALGGGWVGEATTTTAVTPSGLDGALSWTKTTHVDVVTAQTLYTLDRGSTANCTGATFTGSGTSVGTGTTYTAGPNTNGHYYCFKLVEADNNWLSQGSVFPVAHLGLFPTTVVVAHTGTAGRASNNDTITITFNQAISTSGLPANNSTISVCFISSRIIIGDTAGCSSSGDANTIGVITGFSFSGTYNANTSTFVRSPTSAPTTLTITLHNSSNSQSNTISGSGTFTAKSTISTAATTHSTTVCTSSTYACTPSVNNGF